MSVAKNVVTRFAPSPTGFLHIGGARTALFNYLFAKNQGGKFLLRVEDTDQARSTKEAIDAILQGLNWLGLNHDGEYVLQTQNVERHKEIAHELLAQGKAYKCYTTVAELDELRSAAEEKGEVFRFKSPWRDADDFVLRPKNAPVIRLKAPVLGDIVIKDLVQGEVRVSASEIDDLVLLRADETPTYMLAVVVDDHDMGITHVVRGDDHFTNAFRQKAIYDALDWSVPEFAHIPLIHGADGAKMSKRHGATSIMEYKEMGYLPEALRNYLLRLGWSHGDDEIICDEKAIEWFGLDKVGKSPARFDFAKLDNLNKHYIKQKTSDELFDLVEEFFAKKPNAGDILRIKKALEFLKEKSANLKDLALSCKIYFAGVDANFDEESRQILAKNQELIAKLRLVLQEIEIYDHDSIKNALMQFGEENSLKMKDFGSILRLILTFSTSSSGGVFAIIEILGKELVLKRFDFV